MKEDTRKTIKIEKRLHKAIKIKVASNGSTINEFVEHAIHEKLGWPIVTTGKSKKSK